jgi:hypothetical protein
MKSLTKITRLAIGLVAALALAAGMTIGTAGPASAQDPAAFFNTAKGPAQAGEKEFGVPASVAMAQAALESAWGESSLTKEGNAFFGIKCGDDKGPIANRCVEKVTQECDASGCHDVVALFRGYANSTDSFRDHGHLLKNNSRYAAAFNFTGDPDQFIREVHKAGYATDPDYSTKIISMMQKYNLYQYNAGGTGTPSKPTIKEGSKGAAVTDAQNALNQKGNYGLTADGVFGAKTKAAVIDFQQKNGLTADGIVGPQTWAKLLA